MKRIFAALLLLAFMLPVLAHAEGHVLLVELETDAQLVENVAFEDGDFIQTYQLSGGAHVQLLRYASFDMNLGDLIASEWVGATDVRVLEISEIDGCPAQGLRFAYQEEGQEALDVSLVVVNAEETLVFSAVYPQALGTAQIDAAIETMLGSMSVSAEGAQAVDSNAEVG